VVITYSLRHKSEETQMNLLTAKQEQKAAFDACESVLRTAEAAGRDLTKAEKENYDEHIAKAEGLGRTISAREKQNTIRSFFREGKPVDGSFLLGGGPDAEQPMGFVGPFSVPASAAETRSPEYKMSLLSYLRTGGKAHGDELTVGADGVGGYHIPGSEAYTRQRGANGSIIRMQSATYEGAGGNSNAAGGYTVSIPTDHLIVPLAMPDLGIFDASMVIPTATDIKIPQQSSFGTSALKAESTGTIATFGGTDPAFGQITLSAFMSGALRLCSWELLQDVEAFQAFIVDDLIKGQRILEDQLLASGTGVNQAQGVFGNTGTGTGNAYQLTGASTDGMLLLDALYDVVATLRASYQANAVWIMSRATGLAIRRAQMQANLYVPVLSVDADGPERILGKNVFYDVNAPALPTATTTGVLPILYGDFKAGYVVGVRGGAGINVKILDQPWANQGQLGILAYRRLDARIRRSEAIQSVKVSHS
jgi:HK97 family phage major capsid protein